MTDFNPEVEHGKAFALLFNSCNGIEEKFKERTDNFPYSIIKDKEETRLASMLHSASEIGSQFIALQTSAVSAIALASSQDEAALMSLGFLKIIPQGVAICPTCLAKAILACEENLTVLKDIQEAVKGYAHTKL